MEFLAQNPQQATVLGQSEQKIDPVGFAPTHQVFAAETTITAHYDLHVRPVLPNVGDDADQMLKQPGRGVDVRGPQQSQQGMIATEDVQRQIAVGIVIAMEETPELMAVQRIVGGIDIQHDLFGRHEVLLQEGVYQEAVDGIQASDDLFVAAVGVGPYRREFQTVERALAGECFAAIAGAHTLGALRIFFAHQDRQERVVPQPLVVVEIFIAEAQTENALLEQFQKCVLDEFGIAMIGEAAGKLFDEMELGFDLPEQQPPGIGSDLAAIEASDYLAAAEILEKKMLLVTLCHSVSPLLGGIKELPDTVFMPTQGAWRKSGGEKSGLEAAARRAALGRGLPTTPATAVVRSSTAGAGWASP